MGWGNEFRENPKQQILCEYFDMVWFEFLFEPIPSINHHTLAQTWMKHKNGGSTYLWNQEF